ncbi:ANK [Mytilus coruscus]|uniref:ANK n=1 Tax=Mytilus coruscus TaxID=42192 RepID=A0A6J8CDB7_MYTCO|nr:ANK [Mytilus coruscus]
MIVKLNNGEDHEIVLFPKTNSNVFTLCMTKYEHIPSLDLSEIHMTDVIEYDKDTLGIIQRLKQNLKFLSENRHAKSDFDFKMMVNKLTETLNTILKKRIKFDERTSDTDAEEIIPELEEENSSAIFKSTYISQQKTQVKCTEIPGTFYDIGCGIQIYSTSDVSSIFQAKRWKYDDFQRFYKPDAALTNYKFETDFFHIEPKDPKDNRNFPKDSSGMITVRVKLPNEINYQFLHLKAYIKFGPKWSLVDASLKNTNGQFTLTDNVVTVDENHTAVFETDKISGTSVSLIGKEELKKGPLEISGTIEEMHGHKSICKILFFVSDVTSRGLTVLLACIEKSKMQAFCHSCEDRGFHLFKNWISKDLVFKPQIKIDITLKGCFTLPRFTSRKRLDLTFLPNSAENFTRFVVEIKHKIDQDVYGILLLTKDQEIVDEISYNTLSTKEYANASVLKGRNTPDRRARTARLEQMTSMKGTSYINRQLTLSVRKCSEDDFLTEKGMMAIGKLLNADKLFETVLHMDMKQVQYDQICEKVPSSNRQAFTLLKTALDQLKNNKVDKLLSALESVGEGGLAERSINKKYRSPRLLTMNEDKRCQDGQDLLEAARVGDLEKLKRYLEEGANIFYQDLGGCTALHYAAGKKENTEVVRFLVNCGINPNTQSKQGNTALHVAVIFQRTKIVHLLISSAVDLNIQAVEGNTALHFASMHGFMEAIHLLIDSGIDPNMQAKNGNNALHIAAEKNFQWLVEALLHKKCDINIQNIAVSS